MSEQEAWHTRIVPQSPHAQLQATQTLISMERWRNVAPERLVPELEVFFSAGWCVDALVQALHDRPDGSPQKQISTAKRTDLVRYLLNQWRDSQGIPVAPPVEAGEGTSAVATTSSEQQRDETRSRVHHQWPRTVPPETWDQVAAAVKRLRAAMRWLDEQISDTELRELTAPFFRAGWSVNCLLHALKVSGRTHRAAPFELDPRKALGEALQARLATWTYTSNHLPKRPPIPVLSYEEWDARQAALGAYDVREKRKSASQVQLEALQQARAADARRRAHRALERLNEIRAESKAEQSLDALYEIGPAAPRLRGEDGPVRAAQKATLHERLIEGVEFLTATDAGLIQWLRSLVEMEPEDIGPEAAQVTRARLRDSRTMAALAALKHYGGVGGHEFSGTTLAMAQYVASGADLEASQEVSDLWRVLRKAIRAHDQRRRTSKPTAAGAQQHVRGGPIRKAFTRP
ncbi:hypothetical protein [Saccharopolyspora hattusasensis]|uniref:hypothetical protein n=1 Tax=Saccharopolyspora hattusasensis TaxID=1128679 RepID=UPI003D98D2FC